VTRGRATYGRRSSARVTSFIRRGPPAASRVASDAAQAKGSAITMRKSGIISGPGSHPLHEARPAPAKAQLTGHIHT
jgi:hypothetical protein